MQDQSGSGECVPFTLSFIETCTSDDLPTIMVVLLDESLTLTPKDDACSFYLFIYLS